ncbi:hypothetical protein I7I50_03514 [Histoplasma capsulatum G186AR]|uniref:Uncharacterized protein n=1 Tax=Ajellomyces capsulatus TaxID=5037 RepID=A0A8H8CXC0_AJECA|nr:hypothetical protein I7I52_04421 [Histoplasma capsulatum]QSS74642.1 hypothetical protein I7I50_03514 [Histoplasma capsulatum G186AR]
MPVCASSDIGGGSGVRGRGSNAIAISSRGPSRWELNVCCSRLVACFCLEISLPERALLLDQLLLLSLLCVLPLELADKRASNLWASAASSDMVDSDWRVG